MIFCILKGPELSKEVNISADNPLRIVAIGGGSGLSTLLRGLKEYSRSLSRDSEKRLRPPVEVTAVVTVTDDGGSSGRLRREFDVLPPGDIRNCMVALSEDEALISKLFEYRFPSGRGLKGHSFGNLFLAALSRVTGDFPLAVKVSAEVLAIAGRIYPSTARNVGIEATLADGSTVIGESKISRSRSRIERISLNPRRCQPLPETLDAIAAADLISIGPGSLFTSVIPNLLVSGVPRAIQESPALKAYFLNLMWQPGETMSFSAFDHVKAIHRHARRRLLEYVIVNTYPITGALRRHYAAQKIYPVENDIPRLEEMGLHVIGASLLADADRVRHNPRATAAIAVDLALEGRRRRHASAATSRRGAVRKKQ